MAITKKTVSAAVAVPPIGAFTAKAILQSVAVKEPANDTGSETDVAASSLILKPTDVLAATNPLAAEIDALGNMEAHIAAMGKEIADYEKRKSIVRDKLVASGDLTVVGDTYYALVKETGNKVRKVTNMPLAVKHLGVETFMAVAKIGLADIDKYLTEAQKAEVIETSESTSRSMKILKRV